ncbi:hypothetical protein [Gordonia alkanivorans]|uniref:hypothetical protein n=1 Tax=Gordonia alkanivorans TaxID=84096 RepID=UPI0024B6B33B|nr:hypothetical protein [Gordonia alkanivorans]MDJ0010126.1 hypothetical protein [Gordonia alkanivorans]MDJ0495684.1 hypothetical protein [Gordonia alkanivorans]
MTADPAIAAAQRAWAAAEQPFIPTMSLEQAAIAAAREALAPIKARLDQLAEETLPLVESGNWVDYHEAFSRAINDLSPLVYTTEELEKDWTV